MSEFFRSKLSHETILAAHIVGETFHKIPFFILSKNEKWTQQSESRFLLTLPFYGIFSTPRELIQHLLQLEQFDLQELTDKSYSQTFGVFVDNRLGYVVKMAKGAAYELARDISSRYLMEDLGLKESALAPLLLAGTFRLKQEETLWTVSIQKGAEGVPLTDSVGNRGRFHEAQIGLKKGAKALAELHLKNHHLAKPIGQDVAQFHLSALTQMVTRCHDDLNGPLTKATLDQIHTVMCQRVQRDWGVSGYCHGDIHLNHLFYEPTLDLITFIDTPSFLASIDSGRRPIGFIPYDTSWVWISIAQFGFFPEGSLEKMALLQQTFLEAYETEMGDKIYPKPAMQLALVTKQLYLLLELLKFQRQDQTLPYQKLIDYTVESIQTTLDDK